MKMTQQEIEAFALQYHGIECVAVVGFVNLITPYTALRMNKDNGLDIVYIELRSIDSLTNEECKKEGFVLNDIKAYYKPKSTKKPLLDCHETDYLRSIGIALPFRGYSVEDMIEQGILKLKQ